MAVYIDDCRLAWKGKQWCHMVADTVEELHHFAQRLGLRRDWFQDRTMYPHYDITLNVKERALSMGAQLGDKKTIVACAKKLRLELIEARRSMTAELECAA